MGPCDVGAEATRSRLRALRHHWVLPRRREGARSRPGTQVRARAEPLAGVPRAQAEGRPQKARGGGAPAVKALERCRRRRRRALADYSSELEHVPPQGRLEVGGEGGGAPGEPDLVQVGPAAGSPRSSPTRSPEAAPCRRSRPWRVKRLSTGARRRSTRLCRPGSRERRRAARNPGTGRRALARAANKAGTVGAAAEPAWPPGSPPPGPARPPSARASGPARCTFSSAPGGGRRRAHDRHADGH